jgi:hypothetical protein
MEIFRTAKGEDYRKRQLTHHVREFVRLNSLSYLQEPEQVSLSFVNQMERMKDGDDDCKS